MKSKNDDPISIFVRGQTFRRHFSMIARTNGALYFRFKKRIVIASSSLDFCCYRYALYIRFTSSASCINSRNRVQFSYINKFICDDFRQADENTIRGWDLSGGHAAEKWDGNSEVTV